MNFKKGNIQNKSNEMKSGGLTNPSLDVIFLKIPIFIHVLSLPNPPATPLFRRVNPGPKHPHLAKPANRAGRRGGAIRGGGGRDYLGDD